LWIWDQLRCSPCIQISTNYSISSQAGVNSLGTDECDFNSILCLNSYDQLKMVFHKYKELRDGTTIETDIDSEMGSDLKDGYLSIGRPRDTT